MGLFRFVTYVFPILIYYISIIEVHGWTCVPTVGKEYARVNSDAELRFNIISVLPTHNEALTFNVEFYDGSPPIAVIRYAFGSINPSPADLISGDAAGNIVVKMKNVQLVNAGTYRISSVKGTHGCNCLYILGIPSKPAITVNGDPSVGKSAILTCSSTSTTTPSNHSLSLSYSWRVNGTENPTEYIYSSNKNALTVTNVTKNDAKIQFSCTATEVVNNGYTSDSSDLFSLNILYAPDGSPTIGSYRNGDIYSVIDQADGTLSCTIMGGNPRPTLTWSCYNQTGTDSYPDSQTVTKIVTWRATRGTDATCTCQSSHIISGTQSAYVNVQILYPPTKPSFIINSVRVADTIRIIRGSTLIVKCSSSSKPLPNKYTWTHPRRIPEENQVLTVSNVQTSNNGQYSCIVENIMNPSSGGTVPGNSSRNTQVLVL